MSQRTFAIVRLALVVASCRYASLSAQSLDLSQYAHTAWRVQDGAPGAVKDLTQTADGVLWIASARGLFQFDGVRFERFEPPPGKTLPPDGGNYLLALPDTSLWVGHFSGEVSVVHQRRVVTYGMQDGLPGGTVTAIARDSGGTMWAATTRGLARLVGPRWEKMDTATGYPGGFTEPVLVDGSGSVWARRGSETYVLSRGAARFERRDVAGAGTPATDELLVAAPDGSVWAANGEQGVYPVADARGGPPPPGILAYADTGIYAVIWSPDRPAVALGTLNRLVRVWLPTWTDKGAGGRESVRPKGLTAPFSRAAGMTGNFATAALYDREGSLWIGTPTGIDRFRETKLTPIVLPGSLDAPGLAVDTGGTAWVIGRLGSPAALRTVGDHTAARMDAPSMLTCVYRDLLGGIWIGGRGLWAQKGDAVVAVSMPPPLAGKDPKLREVQAIARDRHDNLWVAIARDGAVFRRPLGGAWEHFKPGQALDSSMANVITADSSGRTWLGYPPGQVVLVVGDSVRVFPPEQVAVGRVLAISVYGNRVWIGGENGVAAVDARELGRPGTRFFAPVQTAGEPLRGVSGVVETADGELWLNGADGVTRIPAAEIRRALAKPGYQVSYERLDYRDGIQPPAEQIRPLPSAAAGPDGRIWFATEGGIAWVDPRRVRRNRVPPPVHLRALTAEDRRYFAEQSAGDTLRLPPRTSSLSVAYTAYSLAVPDRVRFKYRLEGLDTAWHDAGGRREAFFTNLPPGRYRFHVIAANDDGVWNTEGASLALNIPPAWNQTWWFFGLVALTLGATPALAAVAWQRRRARLAAERAQRRFEAVLEDRTRVARELHDKLLGGITGVVLQLDAGAQRLARGDSDTAAAANLFSTLGSQARQALTDTREFVVAMRTSARGRVLHEELADSAQRTFAGTEIVVHFTQAGTAVTQPPTVQAEIISIAGEALANARNHSGCRTVWVICDSGPRELRVGVRDDGNGFDLSQPTPTGHWGLIGMRERAASIGAKLFVTSAPGAGTEVVLVLPERSGWAALWSRLIRRNFVPQ
jgi:signal transduction histidine kinase/ligand-binding sensor domain-containing protein